MYGQIKNKRYFAPPPGPPQNHVARNGAFARSHYRRMPTKQTGREIPSSTADP